MTSFIEDYAPFIVGLAIASLLLVFLVVGLWALPNYHVYSQTLKGKAALREAEYTRQIAQLDADAQVVEATGEAESNRILIEGLGGADNYLKWRYIRMLESTGEQTVREVIYLDGNEFLPISEANRLAPPQQE